MQNLPLLFEVRHLFGAGETTSYEDKINQLLRKVAYIPMEITPMKIAQQLLKNIAPGSAVRVTRMALQRSALVKTVENTEVWAEYICSDRSRVLIDLYDYIAKAKSPNGRLLGSVALTPEKKRPRKREPSRSKYDIALSEAGTREKLYFLLTLANLSRNTESFPRIYPRAAYNPHTDRVRSGTGRGVKVDLEAQESLQALLDLGLTELEIAGQMHWIEHGRPIAEGLLDCRVSWRLMSNLVCPACHCSERPPTLLGKIDSLIYVRCVACTWVWHPKETEGEELEENHEEES